MLDLTMTTSAKLLNKLKNNWSAQSIIKHSYCRAANTWWEKNYLSMEEGNNAEIGKAIGRKMNIISRELNVDKD